MPIDPWCKESRRISSTKCGWQVAARSIPHNRMQLARKDADPGTCCTIHSMLLGHHNRYPNI